MSGRPPTRTPARNRGDGSAPSRAATRVSDRPSATANARGAAPKPRDNTEIRVHGDGAGKRSEAMRATRVLVVEDEAVVAMLLAEVLEGMGHGVCGIEAAEADAVATALRCKPDLMIVDARLGDGCGVSAVEEILRAGPVPHVFVSGDALSVQRLKPGAVVIQKPFHESDLARAIQQVLGAAAAC
jgi:CheY-like chemotaxis protein